MATTSPSNLSGQREPHQRHRPGPRFCDDASLYEADR